MMKTKSLFFLISWTTISCLVGWFYSAEFDLSHALQPGYDAFGRHLVPLVLSASYHSLAIVTAAFITATLLGAMIAIAIELSQKLRPVLLVLLEWALSFPTVLLGLSWAAVFGAGYDTLFFSLTIGAIPSIARFFQLRLTQTKRQDFVQATQGLGASTIHIARRHYLPELLAAYAAKAPNLFAGLLLTEAGLSFLGMGAPLGAVTWGNLLAQARDYLIEAPHIAFFSGIPLVLCTLSLEDISHRYSKKGVLR